MNENVEKINNYITHQIHNSRSENTVGGGPGNMKLIRPPLWLILPVKGPLWVPRSAIGSTISYPDFVQCA